MATLKSRLARVEDDLQFNHWFRVQRWLDTQTLQQLEEFVASYGILNPFCDPPLGSTPLDKVDRTQLIKVWKKDQRIFGSRTSQELKFYAEHAHWPEHPCGQKCLKPAYDKLRAKLRMENTCKIADGEHK